MTKFFVFSTVFDLSIEISQKLMLNSKTRLLLNPILCFGEISWDLATQVDFLPEGESDSHVLSHWRGPGGCALNTATALAALHVPTFLLGNQIIADEPGRKLKEHLKPYRFLSWHTGSSNAKSTPTCQIFIENKTGRRSFLLSHEEIQNVPQETIQKTRRLLEKEEIGFAFIQCYLRKAAVSILRNLQTKTTLMTQDLNPTDPLLPSFEYLQISIPKTHDSMKESLLSLSKSYFKHGARQLMITCGSEGVFYCSQKPFEGSSQAGKNKKSVFWIFQKQKARNRSIDTTGCGDAFRAGFMYGLNQGLSIQDCLQWGQKLGAMKATIKGSCLPAQIPLTTK